MEGVEHVPQPLSHSEVPWTAFVLAIHAIWYCVLLCPLLNYKDCKNWNSAWYLVGRSVKCLLDKWMNKWINRWRGGPVSMIGVEKMKWWPHCLRPIFNVDNWNHKRRVKDRIHSLNLKTQHLLFFLSTALPFLSRHPNRFHVVVLYFCFSSSTSHVAASRFFRETLFCSLCLYHFPAPQQPSCSVPPYRNSGNSFQLHSIV